MAHREHRDWLSMQEGRCSILLSILVQAGQLKC